VLVSPNNDSSDKMFLSGGGCAFGASVPYSASLSLMVKFDLWSVKVVGSLVGISFLFGSAFF